MRHLGTLHTGPVLRVRLLATPARYSIVQVRAVERMTLPPALVLDDLPGDTARGGFWAEALDRDGNVRHRVLVPDPTGFDDEIVGERGEISREPLAARERVVEVLLPDSDEIERLAIFSSRRFEAGTELATEARQVARLPLRKAPRESPRTLEAPRGRILGLTRIDPASSPGSFNILLLAEGFTLAEQPAFDQACASFVDALVAEPWFAVSGAALNVYRLNVASQDSGASSPDDCADGSAGVPVTANTYFGATYCATGSLRRVLKGNETLVRDVADTYLPAWHLLVVLVNSDEYGGSGGYRTAWTSLWSDSAAGYDWREAALHEFGHAMYLGDEYASRLGCARAEEEINRYHATGEPHEVNITTLTARDQIAWGHLIAAETLIPTTTNPDCALCDDAHMTAGGGSVGLYEGANGYHCGVYRPAPDCRMRSLGQPFCLCCQWLLETYLGAY
jgi:hypothetical protein